MSKIVFFLSLKQKFSYINQKLNGKMDLDELQQ